ncbi:MAG: hypothetical protein L3K06_05110, partial [Thermoplasmata archaeon]|nr:hypothetical protein [Thermoplasmata archaeon]
SFAQPALTNHSFGVVAEGHGALLLERGYNASPTLFDPTVQAFDARTLSALTASDVMGSRIVGAERSYSLWYGPFTTLYPGNYTAAFTLESSAAGNNSTSLLRIDVTANKGATTLASQNLFVSNFSASNTPTVFVLSFHLSNILTNVELRGMGPTGAATIALDAILLTQTSAD